MYRIDFLNPLITLRYHTVLECHEFHFYLLNPKIILNLKSIKSWKKMLFLSSEPTFIESVSQCTVFTKSPIWRFGIHTAIQVVQKNITSQMVLLDLRCLSSRCNPGGQMRLKGAFYRPGSRGSLLVGRGRAPNASWTFPFVLAHLLVSTMKSEL